MAPVNLKIFVRFVICLILFWLIFQFVNFKSGAGFLLSADLRPILLILFLYPVVFVLLAVRWKVLLGAQGIVANSWSLFRFYWIGAFFSNFLPSNIGGDLTRVAFLSRGKRLAAVTASVLIERLSGVTVLIVLLAISLCFRPQYFDIYRLKDVLWFGIFVFVLFILSSVFLSSKFNQMLEVNYPSDINSSRRIVIMFFSFIKAVSSYRGKSREVFISLVCSLCYYLTIVFVHSLLVRALHIDFPLSELFYIVPVINLLSLLPISINALGLAEGATVFFYSQVGMPPEKALALALLARLLSILCSLVGGVIWFFERSDVGTYRCSK